MNRNELKTYHAFTGRLFSLWMGPLLIQIIFIFIYTSGSETLTLPTTVANRVTLFFWFAVTIGTFSFLFFNHLQHARKIKITIDGKQMIFEQLDQSLSVPFSEIQSVTEYSISKMPWSGVFYWKIKTSEKEFIISSLTVSRLNFGRYFHNKTGHVTSFFPILPTE